MVRSLFSLLVFSLLSSLFYFSLSLSLRSHLALVRDHAVLDKVTYAKANSELDLNIEFGKQYLGIDAENAAVWLGKRGE